MPAPTCSCSRATASRAAGPRASAASAFRRWTTPACEVLARLARAAAGTGGDALAAAPAAVVSWVVTRRKKPAAPKRASGRELLWPGEKTPSPKRASGRELLWPGEKTAAPKRASGRQTGMDSWGASDFTTYSPNPPFEMRGWRLVAAGRELVANLRSGRPGLAKNCRTERGAERSSGASPVSGRRPADTSPKPALGMTVGNRCMKGMQVPKLGSGRPGLGKGPEPPGPAPGARRPAPGSGRSDPPPSLQFPSRSHHLPPAAPHRSSPAGDSPCPAARSG